MAMMPPGMSGPYQPPQMQPPMGGAPVAPMPSPAPMQNAQPGRPGPMMGPHQQMMPPQRPMPPVHPGGQQQVGPMPPQRRMGQQQPGMTTDQMQSSAALRHLRGGMNHRPPMAQ